MLWLRPVRHATEPPQQHLHPRPRWPAAAARGSLEPLPVERPCPTKDGAWQRPRLRRLAPPGGGTAKETVAGGKGGDGGGLRKGLRRVRSALGLHGKNDAVCGTVLRAYRPPPKAKLLSEKPNEIPLLAPGNEWNGLGKS